VERDGRSGMLEDLVDGVAENQETRDGRDDRGEAVGLGWLEFDLERVHGRTRPPAAIDRQPRWAAPAYAASAGVQPVRSYGQDMFI
jgi:hypothetical protein